MLILGLLGMYFDAAIVFVTSQTLLLKLAVAILWTIYSATSFLEKCRKVVREIWFEKSGSRNLVREKWLTRKKDGFIP